MIGPEPALVVCRFFFDGAALFLWGAAAYLSALVPRDLQFEIWAQLGLLRRIALACLIATAIVMLPLRAAIIGDGWLDALNLDSLLGVAFDTTIGTAWLCQSAGAILLLCTSLLPHGLRIGATALASAFILASLPITGHAAMNGGWLGILHRANDVVHLLAGGAWFGALFPVLLTLSRLKESHTRDQAIAALIRFSTAGHVAVAIVILSGIVNMLLILGGPPLDWTFAYQRLLTIKIGLVAAMTLIAIANRYVFAPRLRRRHKSLVVGTMAEILLATAVIALVAWFGTLEPAG